MDLVTNQSRIANKWFQRGDQATDHFAKFFFYFSGFNSMYFLWGLIDRRETGDQKRMRRLVSRLCAFQSQAILNDCSDAVAFFSNRTIMDMSERDPGNSSLGTVPDPDPRLKLSNTLSTAAEKIEALGEVVYQVRCNLVHGSKLTDGDDSEIVRQCVRPLRAFLRSSLDYTRNNT
jgi:hypothetical protein